MIEDIIVLLGILFVVCYVLVAIWNNSGDRPYKRRIKAIQARHDRRIAWTKNDDRLFYSDTILNWWFKGYPSYWDENRRYSGNSEDTVIKKERELDTLLIAWNKGNRNEGEKEEIAKVVLDFVAVLKKYKTDYDEKLSSGSGANSTSYDDNSGYDDHGYEVGEGPDPLYWH